MNKDCVPVSASMQDALDNGWKPHTPPFAIGACDREPLSTPNTNVDLFTPTLTRSERRFL